MSKKLRNITQEELQTILAEHQLWLSDNAQGCQANLSKTNLKNAHLSQKNLTNADISESNLSGSNLSGSNLSGSNLSEADLSHTNLYQADLSEANLYCTNLSEANISEANLSEANLERATLRKTKIEKSRLDYANLNYTDIAESSLNESNLTQSDITHARITNSNITHANLQQADLSNTSISNTILNNSSLYGIKLQETTISDSSLENSDLIDTNLFQANIKNTSFKKSELIRSNCFQATFIKCDLEEASLYNAAFIESNLFDCNLNKCNAEGTNFNLADLTHSTLSKIKLDSSTTFIGANLSYTTFTQPNFPDNQRFANTPQGKTPFIAANMLSAKISGFDWSQTVLAGASYETADNWSEATKITNDIYPNILKTEIKTLTNLITNWENSPYSKFKLPPGPEIDDDTNGKTLKNTKSKILKYLKESEKEKLDAHKETTRRIRINSGIAAVSQSIKQTDSDLYENSGACRFAKYSAYSAIIISIVWISIQHWVNPPNFIQQLQDQRPIQPDININNRLDNLLRTATTPNNHTDTNKNTSPPLPPARSDGIAALLAQERLLTLLWRISPSLLGFFLGVLLLRHHRQLLVHRGNLLAQKHALEKATGILSAANYLIAPDDNYEAQMMKVFDNVQKSLLGGDKGGKAELEKDDAPLPDPLAAARSYLSGKGKS